MHGSNPSDVSSDAQTVEHLVACCGRIRSGSNRRDNRREEKQVTNNQPMRTRTLTTKGTLINQDGYIVARGVDIKTTKHNGELVSLLFGNKPYPVFEARIERDRMTLVSGLQIVF